MLLAYKLDCDESHKKSNEFQNQYKASEYETEDAKKAAEKRVYELYSNTSSLAMKGLLQLGLRLCEMLNPMIVGKFLNIPTEPSADKCFHLTDFLALIEGMENDLYFKQQQEGLNNAINNAIQIERDFSFSLLWSNIYAPRVNDRNSSVRILPMNLDMQNIYFSVINQHNERNALEHSLSNQSLLTGPLCEFFSKFHQQCTTMESKRQAYVNLANCIFTATHSAGLADSLRKIVIPTCVPTNETAEQSLNYVKKL